MLFPSEIFIFVFLPAVVILYFGIFRRWITAKNIFLFIASILFYAYGEPVYVFLMLIVIMANYLLAILTDKFRENKAAVIFLFIIMLAADLGILLYFKYSKFIIVNFNNISGSNFLSPSVRLPIGISFFTFQAMSYVIDIYRKHGEVQKNPINTGLYIAFFPQLIAGPIVRYETIAKQIKNRRENLDDFCKGISRFILGLGKKVILANQFAVVADSAFENISENSFTFLWLGAVSYTFQIFFDFSGYSDMAIGLGKIFGFHFEENFNYPYIAGSISEFWRRWHISLQTWFRDYVYFPLGGSRVNKWRLVFNLFVVWVLTGIWHGANWTFLCWGIMYFILLAFEKFSGFGKKGGILGHIYTLLFVVIGWVIFRSADIAEAGSYIAGMFGFGHKDIVDMGALQYLKQYAVYYIIALISCTPIIKILDEYFRDLKTAEGKRYYKIAQAGSVAWNAGYTVIMLGIFAVSIFFIFNNAYNPFIYFNF